MALRQTLYKVQACVHTPLLLLKRFIRWGWQRQQLRCAPDST